MHHSVFSVHINSYFGCISPSYCSSQTSCLTPDFLAQTGLVLSPEGAVEEQAPKIRSLTD
ncbi:hypothetical protein ALO64_200098 [Pseudomonas meliae]|uniref:Uncharacterized protein n=1 Tax=Pseudomonas meliae TaxID=86176 RepID=A0A0P9U5H8_9PSED|nr:hypothetical protein ALO64_200098 [Pseudomonas meliae]